MNSIIICAFPGSGKTYYVEHNTTKEDYIDLDSNKYTLGHKPNGEVRNPHFPENYIDDIKKQIGFKKIILISCHISVIKNLVKQGFKPILIYPERELLREYQERYERRKNSQPFIDLLTQNWDMFLDELHQQQGCEHIVLKEGQYISDVIANSTLQLD